jgi:hypothetical protein
VGLLGIDEVGYLSFDDTWIMHTIGVPSAGPTRLMLVVVE